MLPQYTSSSELLAFIFKSTKVFFFFCKDILGNGCHREMRQGKHRGTVIWMLCCCCEFLCIYSGTENYIENRCHEAIPQPLLL